MERVKINQNILIEPSEIKAMQEEVLANIKAVVYLKKLGIDEQGIKENIDKIYDFACDMKNCKDCKGLKYCKKEPKYLVTSITVNNGFVDRNIVPCKKYLEYISFRNKILVRDFPEEWLENKINEVSNLRSKSSQAVLKKYMDASNQKSNGWIFIKGDIASGKSFFAAALVSDAARTGTFDKVGFVNVPARFKELSDLAFQKNPMFNTEIEKYQNVDFLVLDDFGNEFKSDFVRDNILFPVISYRIKNNKFTVITSNYSIEDCATMYQTNYASKPKIEQLRSMLKNVCGDEIILLNPAIR